MKKLIRIVALAAVGGERARAHAQVYPSRPITMNVPYRPRAVGRDGARRADGLRAALGQAIVIEMSPARGAASASGRGRRAAPDGYTDQRGQLDTHVANAISTCCRMICAATSTRFRCFPLRPT